MKKELSIVTAYIQAHNLLEGSFFNTIDESYRIAKMFAKSYPPECTWEEEHYDEAIEEFTKENKGQKY